MNSINDDNSVTVSTTTTADTGADIEIATGTTGGTDSENSKQHRPWRDVLPVHPAADLFPLMSEAELRELADDIAKNDLQEPIALFEDPVLGLCVLDGRNRLDALELLGRNACPSPSGLGGGIHQAVGWYDPFDPFAYVISKNIRRRHLSPEQRSDLIIKIITMKPEKNDRQIAKEIGADHKTIGRARAKGEDVGRIPHVEARTDTKGRKQPAKKKSKPKSATAKATPAKAKKPITYDLSLLRAAWRQVESMAAAANMTRLLVAIEQLAKQADTALEADTIKLEPAQGLQ